MSVNHETCVLVVHHSSHIVQLLNCSIYMCFYSQHPALTGIGLHDCESVTDAGLHALQDCAHLAAVDLLGCSEVTDKGLASLLAACKNIQPNALQSVAKGDLYCEALAKCRPGLTAIDLKESECLTDKGIEAIATNFTDLAELNLQGCTEVCVIV